MITVGLHGAEFFARHGFYPEEQLLGCRFLVDVSVEFAPADELKKDNLANTVDYEKLYQLVYHQMQHPRKLIETLGHAIIEDIKKEYPDIDNAEVKIRKLNPPMHGVVDHTSVTITYNKP
jgi:dihydroneopterin aldolase